MIVSTMTVILTEQVAAAPVKTGSKSWRVKIATPGQGSSGYYSPEVLREYGSVAFPSGTKAYVSHKKPQDRSILDIVGTYGGAYWLEEENALFADLKPATSKWAEVLEELGPLVGASISASGTKDADGNVLTMEYSRANSVDLVPEPGLLGSGLQEQIESLIESARFDSEKPGVTSGAGDRKNNMDKMEEKLDKLISLFESFVADKGAKAEADAQAKVDADAISTAVTESISAYDAKVALIEAEKELLPSQRTYLREQAKAGADVAPLIESAKKIIDEAKSAVLTESEVGRGFTSATEDWNVSGVRF